MEIPLTAIDQALNITASLLCMQTSKYIEITNPLHIWLLRIAYALSQAAQFFLMHVIRRRIEMAADRRTVRVLKESNLSEDEYEDITYTEYDVRELRKLVRSTLFQVPIVLFMHFKFGLPQPLVLQIVALFKSFFLCPLFMAYLRRMHVERPFEKNMLFGRGPYQASTSSGSKTDRNSGNAEDSAGQACNAGNDAETVAETVAENVTENADGDAETSTKRREE